MITKEELSRNSPCLVHLRLPQNEDEIVLIVDYYKEDSDRCYQCLVKRLNGDTYKEDIGAILNWKVEFIQKYGELYKGTLTLNLKNEKVQIEKEV